MSGAFGLAGWHFSRNPTSSSSENKVSMAPGSEPWNTGSDAKYQYHPGGDRSKGKKDAPSALNEVIIPGVNLPKVSLTSIFWEGRGEADERGEAGGKIESRAKEDCGRGSMGARQCEQMLISTAGTTREVQQVGQGGLLEVMLLDSA